MNLMILPILISLKNFIMIEFFKSLKSLINFHSLENLEKQIIFYSENSSYTNVFHSIIFNLLKKILK